MARNPIILDRTDTIASHVLSRKGPCRAATTGNITLSGEQTVDGVALVAEDRVLVKDQANGLNGIYVCKTGDWELAKDFNHPEKITKGSKVFVTDGTANGRTDWFVVTEGNPFPGRATISFARVASAASIEVTPTGGISSTDLQSALAELDAEKQPLDADLTAIAALTTQSYGRGLLTYADEAAFKAGVNLEANTDYYAPGGSDVAVADGGTGRSSATAYAVICGGATSTGAQQSIASVGSSGQVLTSNGAGALPTFQNPAGAGMTLLTSGTISSSQATLDIVLTGYTGYRALKFVLTSFVPVTDDVELWMQLSTDGGSTWDSSGYSYAAAFSDDTQANNPTSYHSSSAGQIGIAGSGSASKSVSNVASEGGVHAEVVLYNQSSTSFYPRVRFDSCFFTANGDSARTSGSGSREAAQDTDAVRFLFESGNIASGNWALYGLA